MRIDVTAISPDEVQLVARLVPRPGQETALAAAIAAIVPVARQEDGCIAYLAHESRQQRGTILMYEVWKDQAALDTHASGTAFTALAARFDELLGEPLSIELLKRIA